MRAWPRTALPTWPISCMMLRPSSTDRKSTRLNSSHSSISYAVFCLKKKSIGLTQVVVDEARHDYCILLIVQRRALRSPLFPYTTLFRSRETQVAFWNMAPQDALVSNPAENACLAQDGTSYLAYILHDVKAILNRSEEHTSELQSQFHLVCRLLLEKKKHRSHTGGRRRSPTRLLYSAYSATSSAEISTLSLHDALPISGNAGGILEHGATRRTGEQSRRECVPGPGRHFLPGLYPA